MRRVARGRVIIVTYDPRVSGAMWLMAEYLPEVATLDHRIFPTPERLAEWLGGRVAVEPLPIHRDSPDWMLGSFWRTPSGCSTPKRGPPPPASRGCRLRSSTAWSRRSRAIWRTAVGTAGTVRSRARGIRRGPPPHRGHALRRACRGRDDEPTRLCDLRRLMPDYLRTEALSIVASWQLTPRTARQSNVASWQLALRQILAGVASADYNFRILNYSARVKGGWRRRGFFCGGFPFFAPQKKQKNRGFVQKLFRDSELDTWVNEKTMRPNGASAGPSGRRPRGGLSVFAPISEWDFINSRPAKVAGPVVPILAACCGSESSENSLTVRERGLMFRAPAMPGCSVRPRSRC